MRSKHIWEMPIYAIDHLYIIRQVVSLWSCSILCHLRLMIPSHGYMFWVDGIINVIKPFKRNIWLVSKPSVTVLFWVMIICSPETEIDLVLPLAMPSTCHFWIMVIPCSIFFLCHCQSLSDPNNYHEFCRLLARLKSNYQLGELVKVENYPDVIRLIANFTVTSLQVCLWSLCLSV